MLAPAFASLTAQGDALRAWPGPPARLRARMAEVYGVGRAEVLPTRGATHAVELVLRRAARRGFGAVAGEGPLLARLAGIYGLDVVRSAQPGVGAVVVARPGEGEPLTAAQAADLAAGLAPALLVVDESLIEFEVSLSSRVSPESAPSEVSLVSLAKKLPNLVVIRSLSLAYAVAGARIGALIARADLLAEFEDLLEPFAIPAPSVEIAETVLSGSRALAAEARIAKVRAERGRMVEQLAASSQVAAAMGVGPYVLVRPADAAQAQAALGRLGVEAEALDDGRLRLAVGEPAANDRVLAAFGIDAESSVARRAERVRDTKETKIAVAVDLDAPGGARIDTGLGFYDHMLEQLAVHGGFGLRLACEGDLHVEAHHVIEDCALALGGAISDALGDRRGIGRYGFVLPMDDAEAKVSLDLGGRPYSSFQGEFATPLLGAFPTQMTAHVFRSLAEGMRAAIHVEVTGQDDHHKVEACFKALGRALRQAIRVEDAAMPSSKGVL